MSSAKPVWYGVGLGVLAWLQWRRSCAAAAAAAAAARSGEAAALGGAEQQLITPTPCLGPARDFVGYGEHPPDPRWPGGARIAVNFVINFEEGSEPSVADGDGYSEAGLTECGSDITDGGRDLAAESMFEYGSRVGFWRVLREFERRGLPATVTACALAMERLPEAAAALARCDFDFCCHGYRWENHFELTLEEERRHIRAAVAVLKRLTGAAPPGWYCRTAPSVHTRALLLAEGGFLYDSDAYNDDLPYWVPAVAGGGQPTHHLVIPYSLCTNDSKFAPGRAFSTAEDYFVFMKDAFDTLREEGGKMMSVGLHTRLIGHAARIGGLRRFMDYVQQFDDVWVCKRVDIAHHWREHHPPPPATPTPTPTPTPTQQQQQKNSAF